MTTQTATTNATSSGVSAEPPALSQKAPFDFNGDGASDILWHNSNADTGFWLTGANASFTVVDFNMHDTSWTPVGSGDFNGDGTADILWRKSNGDLGYWLMNPGGTFTGYTAVTLSNVETSWKVAGTAHFAGSPYSDILWRNDNGDTGAWLMDGHGGHTAVDFGMVDNAWSIQGVGDFNSDGKSDILWRNSNGQVGWWLSSSGTGYTGWSAVTLATVESSWVIQGVGDFTGSGQSDILWRNTNGDVGFWKPNGANGFTAVDIGVVDTSWTIQGVYDFNGDGKADLLWRKSDGTVGEWTSTAGAGFTGFTARSLANVAPTDNWSVVGNNPALGGGTTDAAHLVQAMAAMHSGGGAMTTSAPTAQSGPQPLIATPAIHTA